MNRTTMIHSIACVAGLVLAGNALADLDGAVADSGLWSFEFTHMPDFDQPRDELPGDGWNHCVPTSTLNLMAYIAAHGLPGLQPGVANWRADSLHGLLSFHLNNLGTAMSTDPAIGTISTDQHDGTVFWLSGYPGAFNVETQWQTHSWTPRYNDVALRTILDGGLSTICIGWYTGSRVVVRNGGHCMTLVEGASDWPEQVVSVRDPAMHDGDLNRQSAYATETYVVDATYARPSTLDDYRAMDELIGRASPPTRSLIDGYQVIYPTYILTDTEFSASYEVVQPWELPGDVSAPSGPFVAVADATLCGLIQIPDGKIIMKVIPDDQPWLIQMYVGRARMHNVAEQLHQIRPFGQEFAAMRDVAYGRHRCLYIYDQELGLMCYSLDAEVVTKQVSVSGGPYDALAYVDAWDELLALHIGHGTIYSYDRDLNPLHEYAIPCCESLEPRSQMEPDPSVPGRIWIWHEGLTELFRLDITKGAAPTMELAGTFDEPVDALTLGDQGLMVVSMGGTTWQFDVSGGNLDPTGGPLQGHPAGSVVALSRSTSNYDPEVHAEIQNDVFLGTTEVPSVPDCLGDFDHDGQVGVSDLLMLLGGWGESDPYMDIAPGGGDETVSTPDLLHILASWGACHP